MCGDGEMQKKRGIKEIIREEKEGSRNSGMSIDNTKSELQNRHKPKRLLYERISTRYKPYDNTHSDTDTDILFHTYTHTRSYNMYNIIIYSDAH